MTEHNTGHAADYQTEAGQPFEVQLAQLEQLVRQLEQGELPLEQALAAFAQGNRLVQACRSQLDTVELKVEQILRTDEQSDGQARATVAFQVD